MTITTASGAGMPAPWVINMADGITQRVAAERHRLRRITELTGRDVRRSWDRLLLDVARNAHRAGLGAGT